MRNKKRILLCGMIAALVFTMAGCKNPFLAELKKKEKEAGPKTEITYTVTFNSNGGSEVEAIQNIVSGSKIAQPEDPVKDTYTFGGWYKEPELNTPWNFDVDTVSGNITLYANWTVNQYTVMFNTNGGTPEPASRLIDYDSTIEEPDVNRTGYTLDGWYRESTFNTKWDFDVDTVSGNTSLYARWTGNPVYVTFNSNDGPPVEAVTGVFGETIPLPSNPTMHGYVFKGWFTDDGTFADEFTTSTVVTMDIIVYAKWVTALVDLADRLDKLTGDTATAPIKVKLAPLTFTNANTVPSGMVGWGEINSIVQSKRKYIVLNLSDCTADGNRVIGEKSLSPSGNAMNVISSGYIKDIILPDSLITIGTSAFYRCFSLTSITIPSSVTSIGNDAFMYCNSLISVTIPDNITSIKTGAFFGCLGLTSITIPDRVTSIEYSAFSGCDNLTRVDFKRAGIEIGNDAFPGQGSSNTHSNALKNEYAAGGAGTYTRTVGQDNWAK